MVDGFALQVDAGYKRGEALRRAARARAARFDAAAGASGTERRRRAGGWFPALLRRAGA